MPQSVVVEEINIRLRPELLAAKAYLLWATEAYSVESAKPPLELVPCASLKVVHKPEDLLKPCLSMGKVTRQMDLFNVRPRDQLAAGSRFCGA